MAIYEVCSWGRLPPNQTLVCPESPRLRALEGLVVVTASGPRSRQPARPGRRAKVLPGDARALDCSVERPPLRGMAPCSSRKTGSARLHAGCRSSRAPLGSA